MQLNYLLNIQLGQSLNIPRILHWQKMGELSQSANYCPDGILFFEEEKGNPTTKFNDIESNFEVEISKGLISPRGH